ncbi:hypothetical protein K438DRAFT_1975124 [Mycena galopus ATCC 62051]|nr:hypothetical protein K438DRAFT_1975124 [Mycena galopus ATCC 62051]
MPNLPRAVVQRALYRPAHVLRRAPTSSVHLPLPLPPLAPRGPLATTLVSGPLHPTAHVRAAPPSTHASYLHCRFLPVARARSHPLRVVPVPPPPTRRARAPTLYASYPSCRLLRVARALPPSMRRTRPAPSYPSRTRSHPLCVAPAPPLPTRRATCRHPGVVPAPPLASYPSRARIASLDMRYV